jgi:hypothetical protein
MLIGASGILAQDGDTDEEDQLDLSSPYLIARSNVGHDAPGLGNRRANGHNIQVNQDFSDFPQDETNIAVNPTDEKNLVGGANDYRLGYGLSGFYTSFDGGKSWIDGLVPMPSWPDGDVPDGGGDPSIVFDSKGTVYYVGLAFERANGRNGIIVNRSLNGGKTWSRPSFTTGDGVVVANLNAADTSVTHDKEWAVVDLSSGKPYSHHDRLYVTWTHFDPTGSPIYEAHSDNGGLSWSTPHEIDGSSALCDFTGGTTVLRCGDNQPSWPVVGPDGTLYVFFRNTDTPNQNQFLMVKSTDGGITFGAPVKVAEVFDQPGTYPRAGSGGTRNRPDCTARGQQSGRMVLSNSCFRVNAYGGPAVAPDGSLYLVWSDNRNGTNTHSDTDIFLSRSSDGGATWSAPIRVNNDPVGNGKDQWFPWLAVAPDGTLNVVFYDRRLDTTSTVTVYGVPINPPGNYLVDTWMARSSDGGTSWTNFRVSEVSTNFDYAFRNGIFIGDYNGVAVNSKLAFPFWADARNATADNRHSDVFIDIVQPGNK